MGLARSPPFTKWPALLHSWLDMMSWHLFHLEREQCGPCFRKLSKVKRILPSRAYAWHDKGQGSEPLVMKQEYALCKALTNDQKARLATLSYKLKKDKKIQTMCFRDCEIPKSPKNVVKEKQKTNPLLHSLLLTWT